MKYLVAFALVVLVALVTVESASVSCKLASEPGMCKGYFPRFYFNHKSGKCEGFVYGGCGGNENNFKSLQECVERCGNGASSNILKG